MSTGIYKIENMITHNLYIGKAKNIEHRWGEHKSIAKNGIDKKHLYNSMRKYGIENFSFEIIEHIPIELYDEISSDREKYWIQYYNAYTDKNNYNSTEGGEGVSGWIPDEEWKKKQSQIKKDWYQTPEGINFKEQLSKRMKDGVSPFTGKIHTEEWKKQHSLDMQGEKNPNYGKHTRGKKCLCIELNKIFESTRQAEKELGIPHQNIGRACRTENGVAGGYHWNYI